MILLIREDLRIKDIDTICVAIQRRESQDKETLEWRWKSFKFFSSWDRALAHAYTHPYLIFRDEDDFMDMFEEHVEKIKLFIKQYKNGREALCTELHQKDRVQKRRNPNKGKDKPKKSE